MPIGTARPRPRRAAREPARRGGDAGEHAESGREHPNRVVDLIAKGRDGRRLRRREPASVRSRRAGDLIRSREEATQGLWSAPQPREELGPSSGTAGVATKEGRATEDRNA